MIVLAACSNQSEPDRLMGSVSTVERVDFGDIPALSGPIRREVELINDGEISITVEGIRVEGALAMLFQPLLNLPQSIPPGGSLTIPIEFKPRVEGSIESTLRITTNLEEPAFTSILVQLVANVIPGSICRSCSEPPQAFCFDNSSLVTWTSTSSCTDGCEFQPRETLCAFRCDGGLCVDPSADAGVTDIGDFTDAGVEPDSGDTGGPCELVGETIDFESIPGTVPSAGLPIQNQFEFTHGITFSLEPAGSPVLAEVGSPAEAFISGRGDDTAVPEAGIGQFFLTDDGVLAGLEALTLRVNYLTPTQFASGTILDIDFDERFVVEAYDSLGVLIDSLEIVAGDPGTGDGQGTRWRVGGQSSEIQFLRFLGRRNANGQFGFGFDNFSPRCQL